MDFRPLGSRWGWSKSVKTPDEVTPDHVSLVYRLNKPVCELYACDSTCKSSPLCLNKLSHLDLSDNSNFPKESTNSSTDLSQPTILNGLKNYGSTCYLNAFLQIYFRIDKLRQAIYSLPTHADPNGVCHQLKLIFSQLQLSTTGFVDPGGLIEALRLCEEEQQDAPEFHCLFMHLLGARFRETGLSVVDDLLRGEYVYETRCLNCGITSEQPSEFLELSLKVSSSSLLGCVENYLKEEPLTGENQYACPQCVGKQNGVRRAYITQSPSLLCIQLLRFRYDPRTGQRKKHKGSVRLPDCLQLTSLTETDRSEFSVACLAPQSDSNSVQHRTYLLCGVLLHIGAHPTSGHYMAVVRDFRARSDKSERSSAQIKEDTDFWTVCDDLKVCTIPAAQFSLNKVNGNSKLFFQPPTSTTDLTNLVSEHGGEKRSCVSDDAQHVLKKARLGDESEPHVSNYVNSASLRWHSSSSAYMVFYRAVEDCHSNVDVSVPDDLRQLVEQANKCKRQEMVDKQANQVNKLSMLHQYLTNLCPDSSEVKSASSMLDSISLVPTQWLSDWLDRPEYSPPCLTKFLPAPKMPISGGEQVSFQPKSCGKSSNYNFPPCPHGHVPVDLDASTYRAVSTKGLLQSMGQLSGDDVSSAVLSMRMSRFKPCSNCVRLKVALIHLERSIHLLSKPMDLFLRSKEALQTPEQLHQALDPVDQQLQSPKYYWISKRSLRRWRQLARTYVTELYNTRDDQQLAKPPATSFNSELLCSHGTIRANRNHLRCLPAVLWFELINLFPQADIPTAPFSHRNDVPPECIDCELVDTMLISQVEHERLVLSHLIHNVERRLWSPQACPTTACSRDLPAAHVNLNDINLNSADSPNSTSDTKTVELNDMVYLVPFQFIQKWRRFIKNASQATMPKRLGSGLEAEGVLCKHGKLTMPWQDLMDQSKLFPLARWEWELFSKNYTSSLSNPIDDDEDTDEDDDDDSDGVLKETVDDVVNCPSTTLPAIFLNPSTTSPREWDFHPPDYAMCCADCHLQLIKQRNRFHNAKLRVRLVGSLEEALSATYVVSLDATNDQSKVIDPVAQTDAKSSSLRGESVPLPPPLVRRSTRQRLQINDLVIHANSSETVQEIKVQIMQYTGVSPVDQHLIYQGKELTDLFQTLEELEIHAQSLLFLWTETPILNGTSNYSLEPAVFPKPSTNNSASLARVARSVDFAPIEVGFKGTRLLDGGL